MRQYSALSVMAKYVSKPSLFHAMNVEDPAYLPTLRHLVEYRQYQVANKAYVRLRDQPFEIRYQAASLIMRHNKKGITIDYVDDALVVAFLNKVFLDHLDMFISEAASYTLTSNHIHVCLQYQYKYSIATKIAYWLDTNALKHEDLARILSVFCTYQQSTWKDLQDLFHSMSTPRGRVVWQYARDTLFAQCIPRRFHHYAFNESIASISPDLLMLCAPQLGEDKTLQKMTDSDCVYVAHLEHGWDSLFTKKNDYGLVIQEQLSIMRTMGSYEAQLLRRSIYGDIDDEAFVVPLEAI